MYMHTAAVSDHTTAAPAPLQTHCVGGARQLVNSTWQQKSLFRTGSTELHHVPQELQGASFGEALFWFRI